MSVKRKNKAEKTEPLSGLCNVLMVRLECYIGTEAKDGIVLISGIAANDAEKSLAGKLASSIRGVRSVTNDMTIKS